MKIDPNMTIGSITGTKVSAPKGNGGFENVLKGIAASSVNAPADIQSVPGIGTMFDPNVINAVSLSEQAVDILNDYSEALSDPGSTLKVIEPMIGEMSDIKKSIDESILALEGDDPLKDILKDVSSTIGAEVIRFRRGDLT